RLVPSRSGGAGVRRAARPGGNDPRFVQPGRTGTPAQSPFQRARESGGGHFPPADAGTVGAALPSHAAPRTRYHSPRRPLSAPEAKTRPPVRKAGFSHD